MYLIERGPVGLTSYIYMYDDDIDAFGKPVPRGVLAILIHGGVRMKDKIQTQKNGFTVNFAPKNIVILHIFCPKIWVTILFQS